MAQKLTDAIFVTNFQPSAPTRAKLSTLCRFVFRDEVNFFRKGGKAIEERGCLLNSLSDRYLRLSLLAYNGLAMRSATD